MSIYVPKRLLNLKEWPNMAKNAMFDPPYPLRGPAIDDRVIYNQAPYLRHLCEIRPPQLTMQATPI